MLWPAWPPGETADNWILRRLEARERIRDAWPEWIVGHTGYEWWARRGSVAVFGATPELIEDRIRRIERMRGDG